MGREAPKKEPSRMYVVGGAAAHSGISASVVGRGGRKETPGLEYKGKTYWGLKKILERCLGEQKTQSSSCHKTR